MCNYSRVNILGLYRDNSFNPLFLMLYGDVFLLQVLSSQSVIAEHGCALQWEVFHHHTLRMPQLTVEEISDEWAHHVRSL